MATAEVERTLAAAGKGCLGKAANDEPVFILRAKDMLAPGIVDDWANQAHAAGTPRDKVSEAFDLARRMREWQAANGARIPD